jgi:hypothetical protein
MTFTITYIVRDDDNWHYAQVEASSPLEVSQKFAADPAHAGDMLMFIDPPTVLEP